MSKLKRPPLTPALIAVILALALIPSVLLYVKIDKQTKFLRSVDEVTTVKIPDGRSFMDMKLVYSSNPVEGTDIFLADDELNAHKAIKIVSTIPVLQTKYQFVNYYNKTYFVTQYGIGAGAKDLLLFDQDGKVINDKLLQNSKELPEYINPYFSEIQSLGDDGFLLLKMFSKDSSGKEYFFKFDITSGKLKGIYVDPAGAVPIPSK